MGILLVLLATLFIGGSQRVERIDSGGTSMFRPSPTASVVPAMLGVVTAMVGLVFAMQPGGLFKVMAALLFPMAILVFAAVVPLPLVHRAIVAPDHFYVRTGWVFFPEEYEIPFDAVRYVEVSEKRDADHRHQKPSYILEFTSPDGDVVAVPICDLVKRALPQILDALAKRNVVIGDSPQGWQIPPDLLD